MSLKQVLKSLRSISGVQIHERVDLRAWAVVRLGGSADLMIRCTSVDGLRAVVAALDDARQPFVVLGAGSAMVAPDEGVRVPVLSLGGALARWDTDIDGAVAAGGARVAQVAQSVARVGLSGLESVAVRPDSVGGAVVQGFSIGGDGFLARVLWVEHMIDGQVHRSSPSELAEYLPIQPGQTSPLVVIRARLLLENDDLASIRDRIDRNARTRTASVRPRAPLVPVFRDPPGTTANQVLTDALCASFVRGSARLGDHHPNLLVVGRSTKSTDVAELCRTLVGRVRAHSGIELSCRLSFVDQYGRRIEPWQ